MALGFPAGQQAQRTSNYASYSAVYHVVHGIYDAVVLPCRGYNLMLSQEVPLDILTCDAVERELHYLPEPSRRYGEYEHEKNLEPQGVSVLL